MIKFCLDKWNKNSDKLKEHLKNREDLNTCDYIDLVKLVVEHIFNIDETLKFDSDNITEIDNGDYQGTLLFVIPRVKYQPSECDYLMAYVEYGSCTVCDTLQGIQSWREGYSHEKVTEAQLSDFMNLCKDIVQNTIKPYNYGWRHDPMYDPVEEKEVWR